MAKEKRYAAGRARALGLPTRGTTNPNRLRRVDRHLLGVHGALLRTAADPLLVDLGYGATPVTAIELHARVRAVRPDATVVGLEIDQERVDAAQYAATDGLSFRRGGFELAGLRPLVVRALNVLRQYDETAAREAWTTVLAGLQPGGLLLEGTCDELGRRGAWVTLTPDGPQTLTLAAHLPTLDRPGDLAERLPKALIHHNVPGRPVHALLKALDEAWDRSAPYAPFGNRQRWSAMLDALQWEQAGRRRDGEVTVPWATVAPD
ncbi:MAG: class I SAM-dependent methyltransferase [Mycobacteriales bacterium]